MIKRKLWIIIGVMVLIVGGVIALTSLSDKLVIEKDGDKYVFWKKERIETKDNLVKEVVEINSKLDRLNADKKYFLNDFYDSCVRSCPYDCEIDIKYLEDFNGFRFSKIEKINYIKECSSFCPQTCQTEIEYQVLNFDYKIEKLNNKKDIINEVIK